MKSIIFTVALVIFSLIVFAQTPINKSSSKKDNPKTDPRNYTVSTVDLGWVKPAEEKDGCRMKDGILRCYKNNIAMAIDRNMPLDNGTLAFMNGVLITRKGEIIRLKNGDCIDLFNVMVECEKTK